MKTLLLEKKKLFDGDESAFYGKEIDFSVPGLGEVHLNTDEFNSRNKIKNLEVIIGHEEFKHFINLNVFEGPVGATSNYLGSFGLPLYFLNFGDNILVFAAGEKQSTRFMVYFEAGLHN